MEVTRGRFCGDGHRCRRHRSRDHSLLRYVTFTYPSLEQIYSFLKRSSRSLFRKSFAAAIIALSHSQRPSLRAKPLTRRGQHCYSSSSPLHATNGDDKNEKNDEIPPPPSIPFQRNITSDVSMIPNNIIDDLTLKWDTFLATVREKFDGIVLPEFMVQILSKISKVWKVVAWHTVTFTTGAIIGIVALVVPLHAQIATLSQPVTLFETILSDLEQAYVEPVDTNKLFETGVAAMLRSLDPYTEFEGIQEAVDMTESIEGKYGGVGLVISGVPSTTISSSSSVSSTPATKILKDTAVPTKDNGIDNNKKSITPLLENATPSTSTSPSITMDDATTDTDQSNTPEESTMDQQIQEELSAKKRQRKDSKYSQLDQNIGIRVVSAFEGYAFDYGMRVGDKLIAIDNVPLVTSDGNVLSVDQVRNRLRGEPGTTVRIDFERDGVDGIQTVIMPRAVVKIRDVKLAALLGNPEDGIGYIQLSGFASEAGREVRNAIQYLQRSAEDASNGERTLQGLVLDLRGNPGGLLTSAVDVASLLVPKGSDIVSAKGRGFPGIIYRSRVDPILDTSTTKLAVLINGNTASAAEIVSGAVQDLDVGVIVGADRTFGKGLVQNVEELPYNTALKFTVAKYYTPSGRCIQGINYKEGDKGENDGKFIASKIEEKDRGTFYTRFGRVVRDGGGIEADFKVPSTKASALELTLFRSGIFSDFAAEWSKNHELTNNFAVDEDTYKSFQAYVNAKQRSGELQLEALYGKPLEDLKKALKASGYSGSEKSVEQLQARIVRDIQNDFDKYRNDLKEDISQSILARYVPESMLIERGVKRDPQVAAAVELVSQRTAFDKLLAKGSISERTGFDTHPPITASGFNVAASVADSSKVTPATTQQSTSSLTGDKRHGRDGIRAAVQW
jgi:carboxyl-terminal processing protease